MWIKTKLNFECYLCEHIQLVWLANSLAVFSYGYSILRRFLPEEKVEAVKGLSLTADGNGVVFDVPAKDLDIYLNGKALLNC